MSFNQLISSPIKAALTSTLSLIGGFGRGTGRTTAMYDTLKGDEIIVCLPGNYSRHMEIELRKRKLNCKVIAASSLPEMFQKKQMMGVKAQIILDHSVIEKMYYDAITSVDRDLAYLDSISINSGPRTSIKPELIRNYDTGWDTP